ncbi:proline-rich protein 15 [Lates calcarifer]|uniref:Proline-rich protein 15 n=1 Tax=Lates calcarifer TaxID=8187 RepID=A0AAJ7LGS6_LATCA|nr:proline-rich protein 15 [Lates calcarifer]
MTERTPWWRAFLPKRKPGGPKETGLPNFGPDFDPFAQHPDRPREPAAAGPKTPSDQCQQDCGKNSNIFGDDTYDDSHLESVFNEQTCRRNMKVSRSGRFKEKRKVRSSLPIQEKETENVGKEKEDVR